MAYDIFIITESEMEIMNIIWDSHGAVTVNGLRENILTRYDRQIAPSTVNTLCSRLMDKGFITYIQMNGRNLYIPRMSKHAYQLIAAKAFIAELFGGSVEELIAVLLQSPDMTEQTLAALHEMLETTDACSIRCEQPERKEEKREYRYSEISAKLPATKRAKKKSKAHMPRAA